MTCETRACPFPATHGKLCALCARMLLEPAFYQMRATYTDPHPTGDRKKYERMLKASKTIIGRTVKPIVQSAPVMF